MDFHIATKPVSKMKKKTAVASCKQSLDDLLKSEICENASIHCTFTKKSVSHDSWFIEKKMKVLNIENISFTDGHITLKKHT